MKNGNTNVKQRGFGIIEIMIVLAIVGAIIGGVLAMGGNLTAGSEVNTAVAQHNALYTGIQKMYYEEPAYTGVTVAGVLTSETAVPAKMRSTDNTTIKHIWSQTQDDVSIVASNEGQSFDITYANIPLCVEFVNGVRSTAQAVFVGGSEVFTTSEITTACSEEASDGLVSVTTRHN